MKKVYSEDQLKEKAAVVFAEYPNANTVYATFDGNVFLAENRAKLHAGANKVLTVHRPFDAAAEPATEGEATKEHAMNAADTIKAIAACQTPEELEQYAGDERKTVNAAYELRKKVLELKANGSGNANTGDGTNTVQ